MPKAASPGTSGRRERLLLRCRVWRLGTWLARLTCLFAPVGCVLAFSAHLLVFLGLSIELFATFDEVVVRLLCQGILRRWRVRTARPRRMRRLAWLTSER